LVIAHISGRSGNGVAPGVYARRSGAGGNLKGPGTASLGIPLKPVRNSSVIVRQALPDKLISSNFLK
jgi:hypothetical protein